MADFGISEMLMAGAAAGGTGSSLFSMGSLMSLAGTGIGALGAINSSSAQASSAEYNAAVASANAKIAEQNATYAGQAGTAQAEQASLKSRSQVGAIAAQQAAGGIDINKGSAVDVRSSAEQMGELNAITIRSNAARTAYGYQNQSLADTAQANLDKSQAQSDTTSGIMNAFGTVLGGAGKAATNYSNFLMQTGGGGNTFNYGNLGANVNAPSVDISWNNN